MSKRVHHVAEILSGGALSAATRQWLKHGLLNFLDGGQDLQACLSIRRDTVLRARRDVHLKNAWDSLQGSPWSRSVQLAAEVVRFRSTVWRRVSDLTEPDTQWSVMRSSLWFAFREAGTISIPETPRALHDICSPMKMLSPANSENIGDDAKHDDNTPSDDSTIDGDEDNRRMADGLARIEEVSR